MSTKVSTTQNGGANNIPSTKSSKSSNTTNNNNQPVLKLSQLQNFCKRDPDAYKEDYDAQCRRLVSLVGIFLLSPNADNPSGSNLVELIQFMAAVSSSSYKGVESDKVANLLMDLLVGTSNNSSIKQPANHAKSIPLFQTSLPLQALNLHRDIRKACVSALILMRNKGAIPPLRLLQLFFQLMSVVPDKNLRESLYHHVVNDIRNINKNGKKDEKLNRVIQGYFHRIVMASANNSGSGGTASSNSSGSEDSPTDYAAKRATQMICDLYRRNIWNDERSIHILASAALSPNPAVMSKSLRFFLNIETTMNRDKQSSEEEKWQGSLSIDLHLHSKKTKHKKRVIVKQLKNRQRVQHEREGLIISQRHDKGVESSQKLFPAIELLNDPYGICETLLKRIKNSSSGYKFEIKMLMLNFVTRVIGNHELIVLPLYTLLQRYMTRHQRDVTSILAYTVQSCHSLVPPEEIYGVLKSITHEFVTERCSGEQMAVGINACRAICVRVPSVLSGDDDNDVDSKEGGGVSSRGKSTSWDVEAFVRGLASYAKHRDRSVSIAGRGWVNFIREVYPSLLQGKDRGLVGAGLHKSGERPLRYGEVKAATGVAGADLLVEYEASKKRKDEDEGLEGGDSGSDGEEEVGGEDTWVDVKSDDEGGKVDEWEEVASGDDDEKDEGEDEEEEESGEEEALDLVLLGGDDEAAAASSNKLPQDKKRELSDKDRSKLKQEVSSTRIFTTAEFAKMQKLVDREQRAKRDPRLAAKLKRAKAKGEEFVDLSDSDSDMDSDDDVHVKGAVNAMDIMAEAKRKRVSKAEKLEKIIAGREKWESKDRAGGSTNTEKKRKKNFAMSKFSFATRQKIGEKSTAKHGRAHGQGRGKKFKDNLSSKKRRRKF